MISRESCGGTSSARSRNVFTALRIDSLRAPPSLSSPGVARRMPGSTRWTAKAVPKSFFATATGSLCGKRTTARVSTAGIFMATILTLEAGLRGEQRLRLGRIDGSAEHVALRELALELAQAVALHRRLHAFGDDVQVE